MPKRRNVSITRTAISPRLAMSTVSNKAVSLNGASHSEDAIADRRQRRVGRRGQGEAEHGSGVLRVDHAVVPQPGGRVVRAALFLVLLPDRLLERLFVVGRPR